VQNCWPQGDHKTVCPSWGPFCNHRTTFKHALTSYSSFKEKVRGPDVAESCETL
jgi:hypothetical protein